MSLLTIQRWLVRSSYNMDEWFKHMDKWDKINDEGGLLIQTLCLFNLQYTKSSRAVPQTRLLFSWQFCLVVQHLECIYRRGQKIIPESGCLADIDFRSVIFDPINQALGYLGWGNTISLASDIF